MKNCLIDTFLASDCIAVYNCVYIFFSGGRRRTIFEYHRVKINMTLIASHTAVIITPLPSK